MKKKKDFRAASACIYHSYTFVLSCAGDSPFTQGKTMLSSSWPVPLTKGLFSNIRFKGLGKMIKHSQHF